MPGAGLAMTTADHVLLLHLVATSFLCGLIWVVQLVHYPLFDRVERGSFAAFEAAHQRRISWIVAPAMLVEAATGGAWLFAAWRGGDLLGWAIANSVLVAAVWASTAFLSVPQHTILARGYDTGAHRRLVATNWVRTIAWSSRTVGLALLVGRALAV